MDNMIHRAQTHRVVETVHPFLMVSLGLYRKSETDLVRSQHACAPLPRPPLHSTLHLSQQDSGCVHGLTIHSQCRRPTGSLQSACLKQPMNNVEPMHNLTPVYSSQPTQSGRSVDVHHLTRSLRPSLVKLRHLRMFVSSQKLCVLSTHRHSRSKSF
jgi:hypothetical protein